MKKSNTILTAFIVLALTVSSCKKHDTNSDPTPTPTPNPTGNVLPTISVTHSTPVSSRPDSVIIAATCADADGSIAKVEFIRNSIIEATITTNPYSYHTTGLAVGTYSYTVKCYDNKGGTKTTTENFTVSAPVNASPVFTSTTKSIVADGNQKNFALPVTDAESDIMTITSITGGSANVTITYNNANVSITPINKLYCGVENLTISVTDGNTTTTSSFTVTLGGTGQIASYNMISSFLNRNLTFINGGQFMGTLYMNSNGTMTASMLQPFGEFFYDASNTGTFYLNSSGILIVTAGLVTTYQVTLLNSNTEIKFSKQNNGTETYRFY